MTILRNQAERIYTLRRSMGMTQTALAAALHVPQSTISRWERQGALRAPYMAALEDLAKRHEAREATHLPSLRLAATELALAVLEKTGEHDKLAVKVLQIIQAG